MIYQHIPVFIIWLLASYTTSASAAVHEDNTAAFVHGNERVFYAQVTRLCSEQLPKSQPQCDALIKRLENKTDVASLMRLAEAYAGLTLRLRDEDALTVMRAKSAKVYGQILVLEPENTTALFGLSSSGNRVEKLTLLRKILRIEPSNLDAIDILSMALLRGSENEINEAREVLQQGFLLTKDDNTKRRLAVSWYESYQIKGVETTASIVRQEVLKYLKVNSYPQNYAMAIGQLKNACSYTVMYLDAIEVCLRTLRLITNIEMKKRLVKDTPVLIEALTNLLPHQYKLQKSYREVQLELRDLFEDIKDAGEDSLAFYLAYSGVLTGKRKIEALRNAVKRDSNGPGQAASWLGSVLLDNGQYDEAIKIFEQLHRYSNTPEGRNSPYTSAAEMYLQRAKALKKQQLKKRSDKIPEN
ncbi:MAG: tetratricopeptide (TPR) repeat protein [Phenylobacterium sp.]|jgi:tetratricopeptide (TPR) repeat protein